MQTELNYYQEDLIIEEGRELGKQVRNINYKQAIQKEDTNIQRNVIKHIIHGHPEGITDLEICVLTGFCRSSVTARRNEIPEVQAVGIAKITDEYGDRLNTLWGEGCISCGTFGNCTGEVPNE